jgi:hypothetical protein
MKCNHSFHQKNPDFKCHVNNKYEEGFRVSGAMLNKKKIQCNCASNKKKLDTGTCMKASPWNTLLSFVSLMWHVACLITSWQTCWVNDSYNTTAASHTHTHTQRLQHEYSFKDQSTEQGGSSSSAFHVYLEVPVSNPDHGPNYPDISHTFWYSNEANNKEYLKIGHSNFLPHPLQFNNH